MPLYLLIQISICGWDRVTYELTSGVNSGIGSMEISKRIYKPRGIAFAFLLVALHSSKAWADDMAEGQKLYQAGKVREAAAYFARAVDTNSYNASAHYFLGNCYAAQKNYSKARKEYRSAMEQTEDKTMESYCRTALAKLQAYPDGSSSSAASSTPLVDRNAPSMDTSMASNDLKAEKVKAIMSRAQLDAKSVVDRAEERCKPIMEEEKAAMAQMNIRYKGRVETTTADERADAKNEFESKTNAIRKDAKDQSKAIMDRARTEGSSVGQGLPNLDDLLNNK
jgi:tetratricopeptide (TPR) repeat protein